ncbi:MAG: hypothetical protein HXS54_15695 [Theionarchaea archaeon]|nr:hypothetical protein [Theionarchaea archaeon]MBU7047880.1 hypothetical protein [Theionarchaea archaeon]
MAFNWDPIYMVNLLLCIIIVILGYWGYKRSKDTMPLYIGVAFGLFGISHLAILLGLRDSLENVLIVVRLLAYLIVVYALYQAASKR